MTNIALNLNFVGRFSHYNSNILRKRELSVPSVRLDTYLDRVAVGAVRRQVYHYLPLRRSIKQAVDPTAERERERRVGATNNTDREGARARRNPPSSLTSETDLPTPASTITDKRIVTAIPYDSESLRAKE